MNFICALTLLIVGWAVGADVSLAEQSPAVSRLCTVAVFKVVELKMNRTRVVHVPLGQSVRYNTLILQPRSCTVQKYAGGNANTTIYMNIYTLPYRVMTEPNLVNLFPPTLVFSGLMSTISPTFAHANYAIIPMECVSVPC